MRLSAVLLPSIMLIAVLPALAGESGSSGTDPTSHDVQEELAAVQERLTELQAEVAELRQRLDDLQQEAAAAEEQAEEEALADLRSAAKEEAAGEAVVGEEEAAPTFTAGALGLQALNPEISVTGDFISSYRRGGGVTQNWDNTVRTLGLHLESYLDPYSRFKAAVPVLEDKACIGEAYFTRYGWRPDLSVTLGKFRQEFGVVNRWHKHGLDQLDFPLPLRQIFGPGGLNQTGFSFDWQMPAIGSATQELTLQVTNGENPQVFGQNTQNFPALLAHYRNYRDLNKDTYLEFGTTALAGQNDAWEVLGAGDQVISEERDLWATALGADLTMLWEPTDRMRYENWVWRTEAYLLSKDMLTPDGSGEDTLRSWGAYSYFQRKLNRTLEAGLRVDYYEPDVKDYAAIPGLALAPLAVTQPGAHQWLFAPYVTWWQSPWVRWRFEWNHQANTHMGPDEDALYLQCTFAAGPHKHERY